MSLPRLTILVGCCLIPGSSLARAPQGPVPVSVKLTEKASPLTQVLAAIKKQTGITVESQLGEPDPSVSLEVKQEPFWKALDLIADRAGARVTILARDGRIVLVKRGDERRPLVSYSGPCRFCVKRITATRDLETGAHTYSAAVEVAWEPGLKPLYLGTPQEVVVRDAAGRRHPAPDMGKSLAPVDGRVALLIDVPLPALPRAVSSLAQVEGHLEAVMPSRMLRLRFPPLDEVKKGTQLKQDGVTCTITRLALDRDRWTVQVTVKNPPSGTVLESFQPWDSNNQMLLVSNDGQTRLILRSYVRESGTVFGYHFTDAARLAKMDPRDWHLEYETPALVVTVPLTFSFRDVPLP